MSLAGDTPQERSDNMRKTAEAWRDNNTFRVLAGWRGELYSVYAPPGEAFLQMERSACPLFGLVTYGVSKLPVVVVVVVVRVVGVVVRVVGVVVRGCWGVGVLADGCWLTVWIDGCRST